MSQPLGQVMVIENLGNVGYVTIALFTRILQHNLCSSFDFNVMEKFTKHLNNSVLLI